MSGTVDPATLLDAPLGELMAEAARLRDSAHGARLTFSPKVFIPLTMLCRDRCGYCTFAKPPAHLEAPYLSIDEVLDIARRGAAVGCHEALFTLGEAPEDRYPVAADWLAAHGYASTVDYLVAACAAVLEETGLLPHANAGALSQAGAGAAARGVAVAGDDDRDARGPARRARAARTRARPTRPPSAGWPRSRPRDAPRSRSPPASSSGIGETRAERLDALLAIRDAHARHGHVQEVIVQNFLPKPGTAMWRHDAVRPRRVPLDHRRGARSCSARRCTCRRRRTSPTPTSSARSSPPASTTGVASRRSRPTT